MEDCWIVVNDHEVVAAESRDVRGYPGGAVGSLRQWIRAVLRFSDNTTHESTGIRLSCRGSGRPARARPASQVGPQHQRCLLVACLLSLLVMSRSRLHVRSRVTMVTLSLTAVFATACSPGGFSFESPQGTYAARIDPSSGVSIDTYYTVYVDKLGHWPRRTWPIGCFSDDDPDDPVPRGVTWIDDTHLVINMSAPGATVDVILTSTGGS